MWDNAGVWERRREYKVLYLKEIAYWMKQL